MREGRLNGLVALVASHQQLVLVLTQKHWSKETKNHGTEERKKRDRDWLWFLPYASNQFLSPVRQNYHIQRDKACFQIELQYASKQSLLINAVVETDLEERKHCGPSAFIHLYGKSSEQQLIELNFFWTILKNKQSVYAHVSKTSRHTPRLQSNYPMSV